LIYWSPSELFEAGIEQPPQQVQKLTTQIEEKLIIDSNTKKVTIKIQPFIFDEKHDKSKKLCQKAIDLFAKDGNPLQLELTDPTTGKRSMAQFKPKSIVCHQGNSPNSGHYFTLSFQDDGTVVMHNDSKVCSLQQYLHDTGYDKKMSVVEFLSVQNASPYIIDYHRV